MNVLIDTNILVYAWDSADKVKQSRSIRLIERHMETACLSVQNLSEFAAVMLRRGCDLEWLSRVTRLYTNTMNILQPRPQDVARAIDAVKMYRMSFWDAQIWAVAVANKVTRILSEDGPSGQIIEGVRFENPFI